MKVKVGATLILIVCVCTLFGCTNDNQTVVINKTEPLSNTQSMSYESNTTDEPEKTGFANTALQSDTASIIEKMLKSNAKYDCAMVEHEKRRDDIGYFTFAPGKDYVYYSVPENYDGIKEGLYRMKMDDDLSSVERLSNFSISNVSRSGYGIHAVHLSGEYGIIDWTENGYVMSNQSTPFSGYCVIDDYAYEVRKKEENGPAINGTYILRKNLNDPMMAEEIITSSGAMDILNCLDNGTIIVGELKSFEYKYFLYDKDGKLVREIPEYQAEAITFGRNYEIAIARMEDDAGNKRFGYVLEDGTFIDDEFIRTLYLDAFDYYIDLYANPGTVYYMTWGEDGEIRKRSLITGEDSFITKAINMTELIFATNQYIYYLSHDTVPYRMELDGSNQTLIPLFEKY